MPWGDEDPPDEPPRTPLPEGFSHVPNLSGWFSYASDERAVERRYGLSLSEYRRLRNEQRNKCAVCQQHEVVAGPLVVDHDHETNEVRGLLCHACNRGLGHFRDDPALLAVAAEYLKSRGCAPLREEARAAGHVEELERQRRGEDTDFEAAVGRIIDEGDVFLRRLGYTWDEARLERTVDRPPQLLLTGALVGAVVGPPDAMAAYLHDIPTRDAIAAFS